MDLVQTCSFVRATERHDSSDGSCPGCNAIEAYADQVFTRPTGDAEITLTLKQQKASKEEAYAARAARLARRVLAKARFNADKHPKLMGEIAAAIDREGQRGWDKGFDAARGPQDERGPLDALAKDVEALRGEVHSDAYCFALNDVKALIAEHRPKDGPG